VSLSPQLSGAAKQETAPVMVNASRTFAFVSPHGLATIAVFPSARILKNCHRRSKKHSPQNCTQPLRSLCSVKVDVEMALALPAPVVAQRVDSGHLALMSVVPTIAGDMALVVLVCAAARAAGLDSIVDSRRRFSLTGWRAWPRMQ